MSHVHYRVRWSRKVVLDCVTIPHCADLLMNVDGFDADGLALLAPMEQNKIKSVLAERGKPSKEVLRVRRNSPAARPPSMNLPKHLQAWRTLL